MGLYEFKCVGCGKIESQIMKYEKAKYHFIPCTFCGEMMKKVDISSCSFHLKGKGFYATDNKIKK